MEVWAAGDAYEPYIGRWSRLVASEFVGWLGPAPGYAMSLGEARRAALREALRVRLPAAADGSIALVARAWAVAGTVAPVSAG